MLRMPRINMCMGISKGKAGMNKNAGSDDVG